MGLHRKKVGFSVAEGTIERLRALSFALRTPQSELIERGFASVLASLSSEQRAAYIAALSLHGITEAPKAA